MNHSHNFKSWKFAVPVNTATFTTRPVLEGRPILDVYHDSEGEWQFLCGTTLEAEDLKLVCLGCMLERDESLASLADLPRSWRAYRTGPGGAWIREEYKDEPKDDA